MKNHLYKYRRKDNTGNTKPSHNTVALTNAFNLMPFIRRETKGKGEKERYTHLNAEFQRIAGEIRKPSSVINAKK